MKDRHIALDARLSGVAALLGKCGIYADIGCDHGRLGAYLLQTDRVRRAVLTDISEESLKKARRLIGLLGLSSAVDFRVGDGAKALDMPVDAAVIAGMGGATIAGIVGEGRDRLAGARLVMQPNVAAMELRQALCTCGYRITDERVAPDGRRNYLIIAAEPGDAAYDERELVVGPVLLRTLPETLAPYAAFRLRVLKKALRGAEAGSDERQIALLKREYSIWEDVWKCL